MLSQSVSGRLEGKTLRLVQVMVLSAFKQGESSAIISKTNALLYRRLLVEALRGLENQRILFDYKIRADRYDADLCLLKLEVNCHGTEDI